MSLLVVGTGALACLFAARLSGAGVEVTMLGSWPEGLAALRQHGVRLLDLNGSTHAYDVEVMDAGSCHGKLHESLGAGQVLADGAGFQAAVELPRRFWDCPHLAKWALEMLRPCKLYSGLHG